MKRETKSAVTHIACSDVALPLMPGVAEDILDSDAALRAEVRRKDEALRQVRERTCLIGWDDGQTLPLVEAIIAAALKPKRTR